MEFHAEKPTEVESKEKCEVRILNANCEAFMARRVERSGNIWRWAWITRKNLDSRATLVVD